MSRREPPTKDEVDVITRAIEAGVADDQLVRYLYTAPTTARRTCWARWGRILGHPLTLDGAPAAQAALCQAIYFRYCEHALGMDVEEARRQWEEPGDDVIPLPGRHVSVAGRRTP